MQNLNEQQKRALDIFCGIKSMFRKEYFEKENLNYNLITNELINLGYLKQNKNGALSLSKEADKLLNNKLDRKDKTIDIICNVVGYKGKTITFSEKDAPKQLNSYWDGGSKSTYYFFNLETQKLFELPSNHPSYEENNPRNLNSLPERVILIEHRIFCGKDLGLKIYSNPSDRKLLLKQE